jgi:hypothetical protein
VAGRRGEKSIVIIDGGMRHRRPDNQVEMGTHRRLRGAGEFLESGLNINNPERTKTSKKAWKHLNRYFLWKKKYIEEANRNG